MINILEKIKNAGSFIGFNGERINLGDICYCSGNRMNRYKIVAICKNHVNVTVEYYKNSSGQWVHDPCTYLYEDRRFESWSTKDFIK